MVVHLILEHHLARTGLRDDPCRALDVAVPRAQPVRAIRVAVVLEVRIAAEQHFRIALGAPDEAQLPDVRRTDDRVLFRGGRWSSGTGSGPR